MEKSLERLLEQLLAEVREMRSWTALPAVLTKRRAARELSISLSKLKALIRQGELVVCEVGRTTMVPSSEVLRIAKATSPATPASSRTRTRKTTASPADEARKAREALKKPR